MSPPGGRVEVGSSAGAYTVLVGSGVVAELPGLIRELTGAGRVAVITDSNVGAIHGPRVAGLCRDGGLDVTYLTFPAGEASKTRETWSILTDEMLAAGLGRDAAVVALGGGVTTDLAGFVAATYMRGVPVMQVPTSYLAMVDASVGGKTGVDVRAGKNLVGAFHAPVGVIADVDLLATLPEVERRQGLVEAFKHGAILDADHFVELEEGVDALVAAECEAAIAAVLRSVRIKAHVVEKDEFEGGFRHVLNFGHTVGHAIEAASRYGVGHGTAVAVGMLAEARIGERLGITAPGTGARLGAVLSPLVGGVGVSLAHEEVLAFLRSDKKARRGRVRYVLLRALGDVSSGEGWTHEVPIDAVESALLAVVGRS